MAIPGEHVTASGQVVTGNQPTLMGWVARETGGLAALDATIHAGTDNTGPIIGIITAAIDGATEPVWFGPQGVRAPGGIHLDVVGGTIDAVIYHS